MAMETAMNMHLDHEQQQQPCSVNQELREYQASDQLGHVSNRFPPGAPSQHHIHMAHKMHGPVLESLNKQETYLIFLPVIPAMRTINSP
jgi:hypothetical protein